MQTEIDALKEQKTQAENEVKKFENYGQELNKKSPNDIISSEDIEKFNQVGQPAEMSGMEKLQFALGITNMALNTAVPITNLAMGNYGGNRGYMPQMQQMNPYMQGAMANPGMMGNNPYMQGAMGAMGIANAGLNLAGGIVDLASSGSRPPQMSMPQMQFGQQMDPIQMQAMINASGQDVAMQNARYMTQMITGNLNKEMANLTNQAGSIYDQKA